MENDKIRYVLPKRRPTTYRDPPLELVAKALDVPLGYLLGGYSNDEIAASHYAEAVRAGRIQLLDELRPAADQKELRMFIRQLPTNEDEIFQLPLYSFQNERALAVIFAIEKIYCGYELLIVNEPPFVLWGEDDIEAWAVSMSIAGIALDVFCEEFDSYKRYFRTLIERGEKNYKVVVNFPTLKRFLNRKSRASRRAWVTDAVALLGFENFNMIFYRPPGGERTYADDEGLHECEVLCKTREIPISLAGMVSCQIMQTPPHVKPTSYIISPAPRDVVMVQRELSRIDTMWAQAQAQYHDDLALPTGSPSISADMVRNHTANLLRVLDQQDGLDMD
ncbi:hypothetical protein Q0812_11805 [Brevundimonas sp. 2R-24]|uniref:Uncharacterized protein n=1 Tax=Peiella sedimenti TaxID=3061083 RepID=A0ABT8SNF5_9CAUL|nr:hypothetical protein [Caulobacteraceae bacterium XZ-24]